MFRGIAQRLCFGRPKRRSEKAWHRGQRRQLWCEGLEDRRMLSMTLATSQPDYEPGSTAVLTAAGLPVGATVQFQVDNVTTGVLAIGNNPWQVTDGGAADLDGALDGRIETSWFVDPGDEANATLLATAVELGTGETAQAVFTDFAGAIWTTDLAGTVDANLYATKQDVYLNGGPGGNGQHDCLPDGLYYVQVVGHGVGGSTEDRVVGSSGGTPVQVSDGIFVQSYRLWDLVNRASDGAPGFDDSANSEYTVQISPTADFHNRKSDNFRVEAVLPPATYMISGTKFEDHNGNGVRDDGDQGLAGWTIYVDTDGTPGLSFGDAQGVTDANGAYVIGNLNAGTYQVLEAQPLGDAATYTQTVTPDPVTVGPDAVGVDLGNFKNVVLSGVKFYDSNGNARNDDGAVIAGWTINLLLDANSNGVRDVDAFGNFTETMLSMPTDGYGAYSFALGPLPGGQFIVTEAASASAGWVQTWGIGGAALAATSGAALTQDFGNLKEVAGSGGKTLGFWTNNNGQIAIMDGGSAASELTMLDGLNLVQNSLSGKKVTGATDFDPTSYQQLKTWLLAADATNMAYMLSAQLAATELAVEAGFLNAATVVDVGNILDGYYAKISGLIGAGKITEIGDHAFITIGDLAAAANAALGEVGGNLDLAGDAHRAFEESLKNALDALNNNRLAFVGPPVASVV